MEENKEVLELLRKIEESGRRQVRIGWVLCLCVVLCVVCCGAMAALVWEVIPQVDGVIGQLQTVLGNLETTTEQLASIDFAGMVEDVDALVVTGQQSLEQTMEKLNTIDFNALNRAIEDLQKVVEPLSKVMKVFG